MHSSRMRTARLHVVSGGEGVDVQAWSQGGRGEGADVQTWSRGGGVDVLTWSTPPPPGLGHRCL